MIKLGIRRRGVILNYLSGHNVITSVPKRWKREVEESEREDWRMLMDLKMQERP